MTDTTTATPAVEEADEGVNWLEIMAALLLGIAGVLTAYAAYNGALAGGDALKGYTQSARTTADANGFWNDYAAAYNADQQMFTQYQLLVEAGNQDTADVLKDNLFSPTLQKATDAWLAFPEGEGPATPLDTDEYQLEEAENAQALDAQASAEFDDAAKIDDQGDNFDLASVYLAVALFFAGIATLFKVRKIQMVMLVFSALMLVPGLIAISKGKGWS